MSYIVIIGGKKIYFYNENNFINCVGQFCVFKDRYPESSYNLSEFLLESLDKKFLEQEVIKIEQLYCKNEEESERREESGRREELIYFSYSEIGVEIREIISTNQPEFLMQNWKRSRFKEDLHFTEEYELAVVMGINRVFDIDFTYMRGIDFRCMGIEVVEDLIRLVNDKRPIKQKREQKEIIISREFNLFDHLDI